MGYCQGYQRRGQARTQALPLLSWFFGYFPPAVAKVYIVSFRSNDDRRPSKFIVLADNMKSAINVAWKHGGPDFNRGSINPQHKPRANCGFYEVRRAYL